MRKRIKIISSGRSGTIQYLEVWLKVNDCEFYWEFGGGDTVALVWFPAEHEWDAKYPWAIGRRREIIEFVAEETRRRQAPTTSIKWEGDCLLLVTR